MVAHPNQAVNLNPSQLEAVECLDPVIAVAAGPGSGKTRTLVERIRHRIDRGLVDAEKIIVLTYTNAGAHTLAERLPEFRQQFIGTLHGFCYRLLQKHGSVIGYRAGGVTLVSAEMADELLMETAKFLGWKGSRKALDEARGAGATLVWKEYGQRLKRNNLVDYDTTLAHGLRVLEYFRKGDLGYAVAFDQSELYVDEAQDSAQIDWQIYNAFPARTKYVCADPDQCLYGFRGAYPEGFVAFTKQPGVRLLTLERNYRSGVDICEAATKLIEHNKVRVGKSVLSAYTTGDTIKIDRYVDHRHELMSVVERVSNAVRDLPEGEIAVLLRTNALAGQYRDAIVAAGIQAAGSKEIHLPQDWRDALDVLNLMLDPRNDLMAERVIKRVCPNRLSHIKAIVQGSQEWLSTAAKNCGALPEFRQDLTATEAVIGLYVFAGKETCDLIQDRLELLPQRDPTLADLVHDLFNHDRWNQQEEEGVFVGTIHSSKGREFEVVCLPAWNEGILPTVRADSTEATIEEERRLAFVAITRAKREIYISSSDSRVDQWGKESRTEPSRFIKEAGL